MLIFEIIFWIILFSVFWTYIGYYCCLWIIARIKKQKTEDNLIFPKVSIIITAYNEEDNIKRKIENSLSLDYPTKNLETIIVSDGSTDRTNEIIKAYGEKGIRLLALPDRKGKDRGQGKGVSISNGDIIILTDAATFLEKDAVRNIVRHFSQPKVGCVSGVDKIIENGQGNSGEGAYVRYEMGLRSLESQVSSLVVVSGCFFAVRRELCDEWQDDLTSDFYLPIITRMRNFRTVLDCEAVGYYGVVDDPKKEFERKVRTIVNGLRVLIRFKTILNPFAYGLYAFQVFSHKLLRWLVPFCLIPLYGINIALLDHSIFYQLFFAGQTLFYLAAAISIFLSGARNVTTLKIPFFFLISNFAALVAWIKLLSGNQYRVWEPTKR